MRVIKHYTVPSGASHTGTQQLRFLAELNRKHYRKVGGKAVKSDLNDVRFLEYYAKRLDWADLPMKRQAPCGTPSIS